MVSGASSILIVLAACSLGAGEAPSEDLSNTAARVEMFAPAQSTDAAVEPRDPAAAWTADEHSSGIGRSIEQLVSPEGIAPTIRAMFALSVLSLAPAVLLMTTCFVRITIVLSLLRQALGAQQLPPAQVMTAAAMFLTLLVMWPVWKETYDTAVVPYTQHELSADDAWERGTEPIRRFMSAQIERTGNGADVWLFYKYLPEAAEEPKSYAEVPLAVLLPAFMLSELKTAFLIGFQVYLPFVVIDLVIASVTVALGMLMLPPALISLPFKLLLFVLVDGWHLVVEMLLASFQR